MSIIIRTVTMIIATLLSITVTTIAQSTVTVHFFLPGGGRLDRDIDINVRIGSIGERRKVGKDGKFEIKRAAESYPICRIVVETDKRRYADTDVSFRLVKGLTDTPVFLNPLERPAYAETGRDLAAFDGETPPAAKEAYERAQAAKRSGVAPAINEYTRALSLHPRYLRALNQLGLLFYERNRLDEAAGAFQQALSLGSSYPYPAFNLGAAWLQKGRLGEVIEILVDLLRKNPGMSQARLPLAAALMSTQQWDEAAVHLRKLLEDPGISKETRSKGHFELAKILMREERFQASLSESQKAIAAMPGGPNAVEIQLMIGNSLFQLKRFEEAEKTLLEAYAADEKNAVSAQLLLGQLYFEQEKYDEALKAFELYLKIAPQSPSTPLVRQSIDKIRALKKTGTGRN